MGRGPCGAAGVSVCRTAQRSTLCRTRAPPLRWPGALASVHVWAASGAACFCIVTAVAVRDFDLGANRGFEICHQHRRDAGVRPVVGRHHRCPRPTQREQTSGGVPAPRARAPRNVLEQTMGKRPIPSFFGDSLLAYCPHSEAEITAAGTLSITV